MNSRQRRKARRDASRRSRAFLDALEEIFREQAPLWSDSNGTITMPLPVHTHYVFAPFCLALCMACGTGTEGEDAGAPTEDAGYIEDAGYDAGVEPIEDAGPIDACEERQAQWCRQGCIGTIGIDRDCPELDCEC